MATCACTLADHFEAADRDGQTWEWVQHLKLVAATVPGAPTTGR